MHVFLETPRLLLRYFTDQDADNLLELDSDPEVMRYTGVASLPDRHIIANEVLPRLLGSYARNRQFGFWAVVERSSGEFLGWHHFRPAPENRAHFRPGVDDAADVELGYRLRRACWGKGYATEGARALIANGFAVLGVQRVVSWVLAGNRGSIRVLEKCGFRLVEQCLHPELGKEVLKFALRREELTGLPESAGGTRAD